MANNDHYQPTENLQVSMSTDFSYGWVTMQKDEKDGPCFSLTAAVCKFDRI
jgi:hypothetical protein